MLWGNAGVTDGHLTHRHRQIGQKMEISVFTNRCKYSSIEGHTERDICCFICACVCLFVTFLIEVQDCGEDSMEEEVYKSTTF